MAGNRLEKINAEMTRVLQHILSGELKDPRVSGMISVMHCAVTNDLKHAKVSLSIFADSEEKKKESFDAVERCKSFIRRRVAEEIDLRCVPELHFELDDSLDTSMRINQLIQELHQDK